MYTIPSTHTPYATIFSEGEDFRQAIEEKAVELFQKGKFILFDPITHTDQCHLAAYKIASRLVDQEYLSASFLINSSCIREKRNITRLIEAKNIKACNRFLQKTSDAASKVVNDRINSFIGEEIATLSRDHENAPLTNELLQILISLSPENHFTYPKFAGILLLLTLLKTNPILFILKVKVMDSSGTNLLQFFVEDPKAPPRLLLELDVERLQERPVLVMEALACVEKPVGEIMKTRSNCAHSLFHLSSVTQHKDGECIHCHPSIDPECESVRTVRQEIGALPFQDLLKAAGAAFTNQCQPECAKSILNSSLKDEFEKSLLFARTHHISIPEEPSIFMVEHMYADIGRYAVTPQRLVDSTPTEALQMRNV